MEHTSSNISPLQRILQLVKREGKNIRFLYAYAIIAGAISLVLPLGIQAMMGLVIGGRLSSSWAIMVAIISAGVLLAGITRMAQISILENLQQNLFVRTAFDFSKKIGFYAQKIKGHSGPMEASGKFLDIITVQKSFSKLILDFSASILQILFGLLLLVIYHPAFLIFGGVLVLSLAAVVYYTWKTGIQTAREESDYKFKTANWILEIARNRTLFSLLGSKPYHLKKADDLLGGYIAGRKAHFRILYRQAGIAVFMKVVLTTALVVLGSWLLVNEDISIGQFLASEILIITLLSAVEKLILTVENIYDSGIAMEKLGTVTDIEIPQTRHIIQNKAELHTPPEIKFQNKSEGSDILKISAGEKIGICGIPGTGRTAVLRTILGEDNKYWTVSINGFPASNLSNDDIGMLASICLQNSTLFHGTLAENIALDNAFDHKKMAEIAAVLDLNRFISKLPNGYYHQIDINSGGIPNNIAKKILLARTLYEGAALVLIDDIWAVYNREEMQRIMEYVHQLKATVLVISNHLPVLQHLDRCIAVSEDRLIDSGKIQPNNIPQNLTSTIWL
ncbi:MAG: ABC transporter ATP-binding protein [Bacteroidia bacterium]|nr:ABC transporter ATP-binding protein [Bacteroidia bacterium]